MLSRIALGNAEQYTEQGLSTAGSGIGVAAAIGGAGSAAASTAALAIPIIGVGIAALPLAFNLAQCGTISRIGCTKVADSTADNDIFVSARQIAYAWEQGQLSSADAVSALQQLGNEAMSAFQNLSRSWTDPQHIQVCSGTFDNNGTSTTGIPGGSKASEIDCGAIVPGPQFIQDMIAYVSGPQPSLGTAALPSQVVASSASPALPGGATAPGMASATAPATVNAVSTATSTPGIGNVVVIAVALWALWELL